MSLGGAEALDLAVQRARIANYKLTPLKKIEEQPSPWRYVTRKGLVDKLPQRPPIIRRLIDTPSPSRGQPRPIDAISPFLSKKIANELLGRAAANHKHTPDELRSKSRHKSIIIARHAAVLDIAEALPHWSLPALAKFMNYRDHTGIWHVLKKYGFVRKNHKHPPAYLGNWSKIRA